MKVVFYALLFRRQTYFNYNMDINFHTSEYTVNQALFTSFLICNWLLKNLSTTKISESKHLFQDEYFLFG